MAEVTEVRTRERASEIPIGKWPRKVLVVDDEPMVLDVVASMLARNGFLVIKADSGAAALEALDEHPFEVGVVIADVNMPHMSGLELANRLAKSHEFIKVVLMSGNPMSTEMVNASFVKKPFRSAELAAEVRAALGDA
jgi:DNA-binding NtrC family response regulator